MPVAVPRVQIDFTNDGVFGEVDMIARGLAATAATIGEDVTARVRGLPGISIVRGRDQIRVLAPPMAGSVRLDLDNQSGDYSPEKVAGPFYGLLLPGRLMRVKATYGGTVYTLGSGLLDDPTQHLEQEAKSVTMAGLGMLSRLAGKSVSTPLYSNIRTDEAIGYLLDAIGWPAADRVLATGKTTLAWWWMDNEDAFAAMATLLNSEGPGSAGYEDTQGRFVFEDRHYRLTTSRCTTSQATFRTTGTEPTVQKPITYNAGLQNVVNVATVTQAVRSAKTAAAVWSTTQTITLAPGETRNVIARGSDIFTAARTPTIANGDITASAGSFSSTSLDRSSGASCTITLVAGASGATVTAMRLWAQEVSVDSTTEIANTISTSASIAKFGIKPYPLNTRAEVDLNTLQDFCNAVVSLYQTPRPYMTITLNNNDAARLTQILNRTISDRVTVIDTASGFSGDVFIERMERVIQGNGLLHLLMLGCEKATDTAFAFWDSGLWDSAVWGY